MQAYRVPQALFDDDNLTAAGGLPLLLGLADRAGLPGTLREGLSVGSPNAALKTVCLVAAMAAGADSIDDTDALRSGATPELLAVRAPSTLGTFLRSFTHGHVKQLDAANRAMLAGLVRAAPGLLDGADGLTMVDLDDTIRETHGYQKQGAGYGYNKIKGLNAQIACLSTPLAPPVIAASSLRRGPIASGHGAAPMAATAIRQARAMGAAGMVLVRADSAYYNHRLVGAVLDNRAVFSITARQNKPVKAAIASVPEDAWEKIHYPRAVVDEDTGQLVSDAEVAEVPGGFVAFASTKRPVRCRLVVRRVKLLNPKYQDELLPGYRHHPFITNSGFSPAEADRWHRGHAVVEQVIEELKGGPLAHLPSGLFPANAAWLACAVIAFNLARALARAAGMPLARFATVRARLVGVPARLAHSARRVVLHLPRSWPWAPAWLAAAQAANGPPGR